MTPPAANVTPLIEGATKKIRSADRHQLIQIYDQFHEMSNEMLRRLIRDQNRIDLLATEVLGLTVKPMHLAMMQHQFLHTESLILVYRSSGKTTVCTVLKTIHMLIRNPELRILLASKTKGNAEGFLSEIKQHLENNARLNELFGPFYDPGRVTKWDQSEITILQKKRPSKEASITCVGAESAVVSRHYDVIFADDLVDEDNSRTKHARDKLKTWVYQTLEPTLEPPDPRELHRGEYHRQGTRYHFDDQYGHWIANELRDHTLIIPALDERDRSPWPERQSAEYFKKKRQNMGTVIFAAQYLCHSEDTEFLTDQGWRLWGDVGDALLASFEQESGEIQYQAPMGRTNLPYSGDLLHVRSNKVDALVTPNHRMMAKSADYPATEPWRLIEAQHLVAHASRRTGRVLLFSDLFWRGEERATFCIPQGFRKDKHTAGVGYDDVAKFHGARDVSMDVFVQFLGFFISEGSTTRDRRGCISLAQNEGPVLSAMRSVVSEMGLAFKEYKTGNTVALRFSHIGLWEWLRENVKTNSADARIPREFLTLSSRQLRILFCALIDGDGYVHPNIKKGESFQYASASKQLADDVAELGLKIGLDSSVRCNPPTRGKLDGKSFARNYDSWRVCLRTAINNGVDPVKQIAPVPYDGNVVCFSVPNGTLITRRNGKILASGNCNTDAMKGEIFSYDDLQFIDESDIPRDKLKIFFGVDLAVTEKEQNDQFAIVVGGILGNLGTDEISVYILDFYADHIRFPRQTEKIIEFYDRYDPIDMGIETVAYQQAQLDNLKQKRSLIRAHGIQTDKDKITRAWKLAPLFENKRVFIRKGLHGALVDQLVMFPHTKLKDLFDAFDLMVQVSKRQRRRKRRTRREPGVLGR